MVVGCFVGLTQIKPEKAEANEPIAAVEDGNQSNDVQTAKKASLFANIDPVLTQNVLRRARKHKADRDWKKYDAEMNQLSHASPKNIRLWQYRAWDLGYKWTEETENTEVQHQLVRRSLEILLEGLKQNPNHCVSPSLVDTARFARILPRRPSWAKATLTSKRSLPAPSPRRRLDSPGGRVK